MSGQDARAGKRGWWPWWVVLLIVVMVGAIRVRLLDLPLERDEGEYAYTGQLLLQGIPPFKLAYTMKLPGTTTAYALIMACFGQTTAGIHFGFLLVNAATIVMVFLLARKLLGIEGGLVAAGDLCRHVPEHGCPWSLRPRNPLCGFFRRRRECWAFCTRWSRGDCAIFFSAACFSAQPF